MSHTTVKNTNGRLILLGPWKCRECLQKHILFVHFPWIFSFSFALRVTLLFVNYFPEISVLLSKRLIFDSLHLLFLFFFCILCWFLTHFFSYKFLWYCEISNLIQDFLYLSHLFAYLKIFIVIWKWEIENLFWQHLWSV